MQTFVSPLRFRRHKLSKHWNRFGLKVDGQLYWVQCFGSEAATEANVAAYQNQTKNVTVQITENDEDFHPELMAESSMRVGESQTAEFVFANGFCYTSINHNYITFNSTDNKVCKISDQGKISGLSAGKSIIKAYLKGYPQISVSENISITAAKSVRVSKITISGNSKKIAAGKKVKLTAKVLPSNAENKTVKWTSSNKKYATVDSKGKVTAYKAGKGKSVKITATATDGSGKKKAVTIKIQ